MADGDCKSYLERFDELVELSKQLNIKKTEMITKILAKKGRKKYIKEKDEFSILGKVADAMLKKEDSC